MELRKFQDADINQVVTLFYQTVHSVNKQDYSQEQLDAWAPKDEEILKRKTWKESMNLNITYIAEMNGNIVGFSDMTQDGYLNRLYIHKDYQRQGIASALVSKLESQARELGLVELVTEASITAKSFFESLGYRVILPQEVERKGIQLVNYKMTKQLLS
ncbi:putative N-acetyltransferase YafP [compost metagenome]